MKNHLPALRDEIDDQIALADRAAAGKDDDVGVGAGVQRIVQGIDRVGDRLVRLRRATVRGDDRAQA